MAKSKRKSLKAPKGAPPSVDWKTEPGEEPWTQEEIDAYKHSTITKTKPLTITDEQIVAEGLITPSHCREVLGTSTRKWIVHSASSWPLGSTEEDPRRDGTK